MKTFLMRLKTFSMILKFLCYNEKAKTKAAEILYLKVRILYEKKTVIIDYERDLPDRSDFVHACIC